MSTAPPAVTASLLVRLFGQYWRPEDLAQLFAPVERPQTPADEQTKEGGAGSGGDENQPGA